MTIPVLEATGLDLTARVGGRSVAVLRDIAFSLHPGRILGVVGESGAGKSMLGRLVSQLLPSLFQVSRGDLLFQGRSLLTLTLAERRALLGKEIAFIPQEPLTALNPVLRIDQQFLEHLARLGLASGERHPTMIRAFEEVGLPEPTNLAQRYPHQLSGGQCQRVLIAMAFVGNPALVIADEPTTALDVMTQARIIQLLRRLQATHGTAVLFITHDLRLAAHLCDELMVLYAGEVVERGPARDVYAAPRHPYTRCLQAANPSLSGARHELISLPDFMPGLTSYADLPGCRFAPRCPTRDPACAAAPPGWREDPGGHGVRCTETCGADVASEIGALLAPAPVPLGEPVVVIEDLSKTFFTPMSLLGKRRVSVRAVEPLSLEIRAGEFVGIVGESGSGKSTVARLLLGLERPTTGHILVNGVDVARTDAASRRARIDSLQMVFQDPQSALNPRRRVDRLVTQPLEARRPPAPWAERSLRARELLAATGLPTDLGQRYPSQLSGGQRQRVNIARALCSAPELIVADEIVSGLDVSVQAQILNLLLALRAERRIALLFISHDLSVVRYLCERVYVMHQGKVVESGSTERVFSDPQADYTRALLGALPPDSVDQPWLPRVSG